VAGRVPETDDQGMTLTTTAPLLDVRCACAACGAHLIGTLHHGLSGQCSNCGSYEVRALPAAPRPGLTLSAVHGYRPAA
jgi:exosome complex RNA-binding protein Csl4